MRGKKKALWGTLTALCILLCSSMTVFAAEEAAEYVPKMYASFWALVPPVVAIVLALITKEVYSSLFVGILIGGVFWSGFNFEKTVTHVFQDGLVGVLSDSYNVGILVFLVILGIMVCMMNKAGGSAAFGRWASEHIKSRAGAQLATIALGVLIFIDDYFNCLTIGTVMRPVTDKFKITRAKLAYIIDATAAPICIIAPVSSWAAAVSSSLPENSGIDGFSLFLHTIPLNLYAWLTIIFMLFIIFLNKDFSRMAAFEKESGSTLVIPAEYADDESTAPVGNGRIMDLVLPLLVLIGSCVFGMLYTGGILEGKSIIDAFAECSSAKGLVMGSFMALVFTLILYVPRKILDFTTFCSCFVDGFKQMASAIFILCLAWTLSGVCGEDYLNIGGYVGGVVSGNQTVAIMLPAMFFLVALGLAFATGTSWGTFGILIPIVLAITGTDMNLATITVAAVLAGAVGGDHVSPISDTTILASAGAQCNHIDHVSTQIPYVLCVSSCCVAGYIVAGVTGEGLLGTFSGIILLVLMMAGIYKFKMK